MINLWRIAGRNLLRYKRRTLLTLSLIVFGVLFVAVFEAVTGSFKGMMIGARSRIPFSDTCRSTGRATWRP